VSCGWRRTQTRLAMPDWVERALSIGVLSDDDQETTRTKRLMAGVLWVSCVNTSLRIWDLFLELLIAPRANESATRVLTVRSLPGSGQVQN